MNEIKIGSRLEMAASFVDRGKTVCDVGRDHGKLAAYLLQTGRAKRVIATDINPKPLEKARRTIRRRHLEDRADFLLADGLDGVENLESYGNITHVVIAGLGGGTMADIVGKARFLKESGASLILLPAQRGYMTRRYLYSAGFEILCEKAVEEKGKFYACMYARYTGKVTPGDLADVYAGKILYSTDPAATGYLEAVRKRLMYMKNGSAYRPREIDRAIKRIDSSLQV